MDTYFEREPAATTKPGDLQIVGRDSGGYVVVEPVDEPEFHFDDVAGPFRKMATAERWIWRTCDRMLEDGRYAGDPWWRTRASYSVMLARQMRRAAS